MGGQRDGSSSLRDGGGEGGARGGGVAVRSQIRPMKGILLIPCGGELHLSLLFSFD